MLYVPKTDGKMFLSGLAAEATIAAFVLLAVVIGVYLAIEVQKKLARK